METMKATRKRIISSVLIFTMILSILPSFTVLAVDQQPEEDISAFVGVPALENVPFCVDEAVVSDAGHTVRLKYLEDSDNIAVFSNPDGTATKYIFSNPIKYIDDNGDYVDIDNTVETFGELTDEYKFKTKSAPATTYLPATIGMGENVKVEHNGFSVQIIPMSDRFAAGTTVASELKTGKDSAVLYSNVFGAGRSLKYTTLYNGVKEDIILNSYIANSNSFNFILKTNGLELAEINGGYFFVDEEDAVIYELSPIFVYDSAEVPNTTGGTYAIEEIKPNDIYALTLTVDETWLSGATYPVTIDPTVTYNTDSGIEDASSAQNDPFINGSAFVFYVGNYGSSVARAYIRFPNLVIPPNVFSTITSANLHLKSQSVSMSPGISIEGYSINSSWTEDGYYASSFPYNNYKTSPMVSGGIGSYTSSHTFDVTNLVKDWGGTDSSIGAYRGILLKTSALNEASTYYAVFHSSEASNAADRPYVTVNVLEYSLPTTYSESIRENRFYWVNPINESTYNTKYISLASSSLTTRDYTALDQRLLCKRAGSGKYTISTESSPNVYLAYMPDGTARFTSSLSHPNQIYWYALEVSTNNKTYYTFVSALDTSKFLNVRSDGSLYATNTQPLTQWNLEKCPTFYGQNYSTLSGNNYTYWNSSDLNLVKYNYVSNDSDYSDTPFFIEDSTVDLLTSGCSIIAYAMIIDNLNIKSNIYDFRDNKIEMRYPDPFYITLIKTGNDNNQSVDPYDGEKYPSNSSPISADLNSTNIESTFGLDIIEYYNSDETSTQFSMSDFINLVNSHSEGVWVHFKRPNNHTHTLVFTKYIGNGSESNPEDYFVVYDPAAKGITTDKGSGVIFSQCKTYNDSPTSDTRLDLTRINKIRYFVDNTTNS